MGRQSLPRTSKVNLSKYVQVASGEWRFCPVVVSAGGRPKQDLVLVNGNPGEASRRCLLH